MEKRNILIVDDDPDLRRGLNLRLRANHYETAYATDGFSASRWRRRNALI